MEALIDNNQQLQIIEASLAEFATAGEVLRMNQERAAKAIEVGKKIISDWEANGRVMTPELDERMKNYIVRCNQAAKEMNEARKAHTQAIDIVKKAFTTEEAKLDKDNKDTPAYQMQQLRNGYAKLLHEAELQRQREIELKKQKEQELINVRSECQRRLLRFVGDVIQAEKNRIQNNFNALTLDTIDERGGKLIAMQPVLAHAKYQEFRHAITSRILTPAEYEGTLTADIASEFQQHADNYSLQITELKNYLVDRLPSKKLELQQIKAYEEEQYRLREEEKRLEEEKAKADAKERERLEAIQRENAERKRIAEEEQQRIRQEQQRREEEERRQREEEDRLRAAEAEEQINMNQSIQHTTVLFDTEKEVNESEVHAPEVRAGYEIEVFAPAAYMAMFQKWFMDEGQNMTIAQLEKKLSFVKKHCEKVAHKDEKNKLNTNLLKYNQTFTSVNRK